MTDSLTIFESGLTLVALYAASAIVVGAVIVAGNLPLKLFSAKTKKQPFFVDLGTLCYSLIGAPRGLMRFGKFGFREWFGYKQGPLGSCFPGLLLLVIGTIFAFVIMVRSELMKGVGEGRMAAFGVITIVFMATLREGLVELAQNVWRRLGSKGAQRKSRPTALSQPPGS